jgi:hypothetical protein
VLDALVYRENRNVTGAGQTTRIKNGLQAEQCARVSVAVGDDGIDIVRTGQVEHVLRNRGALVLEIELGLVAKRLFDVVQFSHHWHKRFFPPRVSYQDQPAKDYKTYAVVSPNAQDLSMIPLRY